MARDEPAGRHRLAGSSQAVPLFCRFFWRHRICASNALNNALAAAAPDERQRRLRRAEVPHPALAQRGPVRVELAGRVPAARSAGHQPAPARQGGDETILQSASLTDVQKVRIEYWADGPASETPPGHWCLFAQAISRKDGHGLDTDTKLFFALANAELDASIAAWNAERRWDYARPITAVRTRRAGQLILAWGGPYKGTRLIRGESYLPYQPATSLTPPFPEYVSGHSTFSAAGARVLRTFTGSDLFGASVTIPRGSSRIEPGAVPALPMLLTWPTFTTALDEAGNSRRQGGIHFLDADLGGRGLGDAVGANTLAKARTYFDGYAG